MFHNTELYTAFPLQRYKQEHYYIGFHVNGKGNATKIEQKKSWAVKNIPGDSQVT